MKFSKNEIEIPEWIIIHLKKYGNCCCGRDIVKKHGKENLIIALKYYGFNCSLRIVPDRYCRKNFKNKYPKNAFYILEVNSPIKVYKNLVNL